MKRLTIAAAICLATASAWHGTPSAADEGGIQVVHPWARPTIPGRPGAGYMSIHNHGKTADRLIGARAKGAEAAELHISETDGTVVAMRPLDALDLPAGGMARLAPGGPHLMLFGLAQPLAEGDVLPITLVFERAGEIQTTLTVTRRMPDHTDTQADDDSNADATHHGAPVDHGRETDGTAE